MKTIRVRTASRLILAGVVALALGACDREGSKTPAPQATQPQATPAAPAAPEPDAVYVVRGRVVMVPDPANPTSEFRVHHERIPDFKNSEGKVVGMNEMEMPFPVADPELLKGVQVGDLVELTFADWYKPVRTYKVTKLVKLPPDTVLNLRD